MENNITNIVNFHENNQIQDPVLYEQVENSRNTFFERQLGKLPKDIRKILHFTAIWPGGGLYEIPPSAINPNWSYITSGLSNPDMPTAVRLTDIQVERDEQGRIIHQKTSLDSRIPAVMPKGWAGYGYELMIMTPTQQEWPLWVLQWAVGAELEHDINLRDRVENNGGFTVDAVKSGYDSTVNLLINEAQPPLSNGLQLPNGSMKLLVATIIMAHEMAWTFEHGRPALLQRLMESENGQLSDFDRQSVI